MIWISNEEYISHFVGSFILFTATKCNAVTKPHIFILSILVFYQLLFLYVCRPDLMTKKRRGGKRMRRLKERFEETEFMKQVNRRAFSDSTGEYGDDAMGLTLGMLENSSSGNGVVQRSKKRLRKANTKASRKAHLQQQQYASHNNPLQNNNGTTSGLASSMVFTPVQGLELVNPNAQQNRVREANQKWFAEHPKQI